MKSRERIESAVNNLITKTQEYEHVGQRLLGVAQELESAANGVLEQTRTTTGLIAGEFKDDFERKGGFVERLGLRKESLPKEGERDDFDRWLVAHKDEVRQMVCGNPDYGTASFCQSH
jgi:hypothetical protein